MSHKEIITAAIKAFSFEHEFLCTVTKKPCKHLEQMKEAFEYEGLEDELREVKILNKYLARVNEKRKNRAIEQLDQTRHEWLQVQSLPHGSFASWVDSVFAVGIKAFRELE